MTESGACNQTLKSISACTIKYIAVLAMIIDHIAWCFIDTYSLIGEVMHAIGRMTAPIMTYFIVEGFHNTRNSNTKLQSGNLSTTLQSAAKRFTSSKADILKGNISIPTYKNTIPLDITKKSISLNSMILTVLKPT